MQFLILIGAPLLALGIAGIIWGIVDMQEDRDVIELGGDSQIVLDAGDFPPIGIAGAVAGGLGALMIVVGTIAGGKSD